MIKKISFLFFYLSIILSQVIPSYEYSDWEILQDDDIWVGWSDYKNFSWAKSKITLNFSIDQVSALLEDQKNYKNIFKRVTTSQVNKEKIVYIVLDMPFPISSRDYVVIYNVFKDKEHKVYQFYSITHKDYPIDPNNIRLNRATGEWRLIPIDENTTEVIYLWNGELLGDFPDWALTRAWETQGEEVLNWLRESLENLKRGK